MSTYTGYIRYQVEYNQTVAFPKTLRCHFRNMKSYKASVLIVIARNVLRPRNDDLTVGTVQNISCQGVFKRGRTPAMKQPGLRVSKKHVMGVFGYLKCYMTETT